MLVATVTSGSYGTSSYTFETYPYTPEPFLSGNNVTFGSNQDDQIAGPFDIGFSFCFFDQYYTQFYIGTNGWIGFTYNAAWTNYTAVPIPSTAANVPKNCIMAPWQDWWPNYYNPPISNVHYYTSGSTPNRKLVVYWKNCPMYGCTTTYGTFQIVLNEQNSIIENNIESKPFCNWQSNMATQGVHNIDGTVAFTATGRNCTSWTTTNESTRFVPAGITWYAGGYPGGTIVGYGDTIYVLPTTTTTYTAVVNTCGGGNATDDVVVTVIDPTFTYTSPSFCQNDGDPTPAINQLGGTFTSSPPGLVLLSASSGTIDVSASTPDTYTITYSLPPSCTYSQNVSIYANPATPTPITPFVSRCDPGNVTFSVVQPPGVDINWYNAPVGGVQYPFTGGSVTTFVGASTHFYAEAVASGSTCASPARADISVTVTPKPVVTNNTLNFTVCSGDSLIIVLQSSVAGSIFNWVAVPGGADLSGFSGGSGLSIRQKLLNTGPADETLTYKTVAVAAGCVSDTVSFLVTVRPYFDVTATPPAQTICSGTATNIALSSNHAGTTFTWTASGSSPNVSGYAAGSGNSIVQTLTNSGPVTETVTYKVVPQAIGCLGDTAVVIITVRPYPTLTNNPLTKSICNNSPTNITLTTSVPGTLFTWTATGDPGISGYSDNAVPTVTLNQVLQNAGTANGNAVYHITPHVFGCDGTLTDFTVTVAPVANVIFTPSSQTICSGASCSIGLSSAVAGATFTWTAAGSSPDVTGYSNGSGNLISQLLTNTGVVQRTVTYTVTASFNGCPGLTNMVIVTVNPNPTLSNSPPSESICNGTATNVILTSSVPGTLFTWTATPSSPSITGYSDNTGVPSIVLNQTLSNSGMINGTVTYHITPHANGCDGTVQDYTVTVFPVPNVIFSPASQTICSEDRCNINLSSGVAGATYTWTAAGSSPAVSGFSNGAGNNISQVLTNTDYFAQTVTYTASPSANGCPGTSAPVVVTVNPIPLVTFTSCNDAITITTAQPFTLKGGIPLGGTYTGAGVNTGKFYPALAGPGSHALTYSYTNMFGCTKSSTLNIMVNTPVPFLCGNSLTDVRDSKQYPTVQIGTQCWMAANLNFGQVIASSLFQTDNCTPEKYCYNDNPANCATSGGLYQWDEFMQYVNIQGTQGLCPPGWHIPTEVEWMLLFSNYINNGFAGGPLKSTGYSGFNASLDGTGFMDKGWYFTGFATLFWSSSAHGPWKAWAHGMNIYNPSVSQYPSYRDNAFSVRCLKD